MFYGYRPYVPVAMRQRQAEREMAKLRKKGHAVSPVRIEGRAIAKTFWGKAWCDNLERYSDYANRLPRGRTYVRNGSVVDLQIVTGAVIAAVSGSRLYKVAVKVAPVPQARWRSICRGCAGGIDSLVELLQGRFSKGVMERMCQQRTGLFPSPDEITLSCSCPDWASMCKHVAAVLYGTGARLDERPELLFTLRDVSEQELIAKAGTGLPLTRKGPAAEKILDGSDLSEIFGLEMAQDAPAAAAAPKEAKPRIEKRPTGKKRKAVLAGRSKARPRKSRRKLKSNVEGIRGGRRLAQETTKRRALKRAHRAASRATRRSTAKAIQELGLANVDSYASDDLIGAGTAPTSRNIGSGSGRSPS
jgi:uncharacterized Zn finger protein